MRHEKRTLIMTHGLPASGKSQWARHQEKDGQGHVIRVNRDDIGEELYGRGFHTAHTKARSNKINSVQWQRIKQALTSDKVVIVDDTNLNIRRVQDLVNLARQHGAQPRSQYFDMPVDECVRRNSARARYVPESFIRAAAQEAYTHDGLHLRRFIISDVTGKVGYARDVSQPCEQLIEQYNDSLGPKTAHGRVPAMVFDMDGTLVDTRAISDRWMGNNQQDFHRFHMNSGVAPAHEDVIRIAEQCTEHGIAVVVVTGRMATYSRVTIVWLRHHPQVKVDKLYMRPEGDFRSDYEVKNDITEWIVSDGYDIVAAIDDNPQVIRMWDEKGIMVTRLPFHTPLDLQTGQQPPDYERLQVSSPFDSGLCIRCGQASQDILCC